MKRVAVIGCIGAGKSTLARALGEALDLPVVHLDRIWWQDGWYRIVGADTVSSWAPTTNPEIPAAQSHLTAR